MKLAVAALVVLGVIAAGSAAILIAALTSRSEAAVVTETEAEILIAGQDLEEMALVTGTAVKTRKIPAKQVPEDALLNPVHVVGKVVTRRMVEGQPFTKSCFAREGKGVYLAAAVPEGKRAMSVQLTDWSGMAGLLYPGSVVDVLVSFKSLAAGNSSEMMATTLLQGLQVLAIGSQSIADDQYKDKEAGALAAKGTINFRMITLLVDPKQAEILQLAMQNGSISLAMRNPRDTARDARRLTRAREIVPNRGGGVDSGSTDIFAPKPVDEEPTDQSASPSDRWETVIIRGNVPEKRSFDLPKDPQPNPLANPETVTETQADQSSDAPAQ